MNAHVKPIVDASQQQREFVLAALRTVCKRLELIREEVTFTGVSLSTGTIDPQDAIRWIDEIAPGCLPLEVKAKQKDGRSHDRKHPHFYAAPLSDIAIDHRCVLAPS